MLWPVSFVVRRVSAAEKVQNKTKSDSWGCWARCEPSTKLPSSEAPNLVRARSASEVSVERKPHQCNRIFQCLSLPMECITSAFPLMENQFRQT